MPQKKTHAPEKTGLHPRNLHRARYDLAALVASHPALADHIVINAWGDETVDFADPAAVKALNAALLAHFYGVTHWDIPAGYLCPPVPGRADYIHNLADLLATDNAGLIPRGSAIRVLDIGVGANAIYPILGHSIYGWQFVGTEIDRTAICNAENIFVQNPTLIDGLEVRPQSLADDILRGAIYEAEQFALTLCNPPFHGSEAEARAGTMRKLHNLGAAPGSLPVLNFAGRSHELWCRGGEEAFVQKMIHQSRPLGQHCLWFSCLISRIDSLPVIRQAIRRAGACDTRVLEMAQGQKVSRAVAWTYLDAAKRQGWMAQRRDSTQKSAPA